MMAARSPLELKTHSRSVTADTARAPTMVRAMGQLAQATQPSIATYVPTKSAMSRKFDEPPSGVG